MADFDSNPFANPEAANPFADPSVRQATQPSSQRPGGMEEFNPFAESNTTQGTGKPAAGPPPPQPAVMQPTEAPPPYQPSAAQLATDDLKQKQEELERKAAELQRKEQEINRLQAQGGVRMNNFPPLPSKCPIKPCFYQDFAVDIPMEFQKIVKIIYYIWIGHSVLLFLNIWGAMAFFIATANDVPSPGEKPGITFGLSLVYFVVFTPCSYLCWFRPSYNAFRSDSSFNFFMFFFIFFFQFCIHVLQAVGISGWGTCGWIVSFGVVGGTHKGAGGFMMIIAALFTANAVIVMVMLIRVHRIYRRTGASFEKAQAEFAQGVWSNQTVQTAAGQAAASAGRSAAQQAMSGNSGNRY